jgi:hypothetical protein
VALAIGRPAAVNSHGRNQKCTCPELFEMLDDSLEDRRVIRDPAVPAGNGYGVSGPDFPPKIEFRDLGLNRGSDIADRRAMQFLPQAKH